MPTKTSIERILVNICRFFKKSIETLFTKLWNEWNFSVIDRLNNSANKIRILELLELGNILDNGAETQPVIILKF